MRDLSRKFKKFKKNHKQAGPLGLVVLIIIVALTASPFVERLARRAVAAKLPDVIKIHDVIQARYPKYVVGAVKNVGYASNSSGREVSYGVVLASSSMPSDDDATIAGRLACGTG